MEALYAFFFKSVQVAIGAGLIVLLLLIVAPFVLGLLDFGCWIWQGQTCTAFPWNDGDRAGAALVGWPLSVGILATLYVWFFSEIGLL